MNELSIANAFFSQILKADATIIAEVSSRVYADQAPEPTQERPLVYPVLLYQFMSGTDIKAMGAVRIYTNCLYLVKGVGRGGYGELRTLLNRADELLHGAANVPITLDGVTCLVTCVRERPWQMPSTQDTVRYYQRGGLYRLYITPPQ